MEKINENTQFMVLWQSILMGMINRKNGKTPRLGVILELLIRYYL